MVMVSVVEVAWSVNDLARAVSVLVNVLVSDMVMELWSRHMSTQLKIQQQGVGYSSVRFRRYTRGGTCSSDGCVYARVESN